MDLTTSTRVAQLTGNIENTPELQNYWERRYKLALESGKIIINTKTLGLLEQQHISRPITPIADICLGKHLLGDNSLDEIELRSTIESIVRLLDGFINILDLVPQARSTVEGYRKIAIGIADFASYFELQHNQSKHAIIDYIGQFIANASYRSSESLAEEKGVCSEWDRVQTQLRPKTFEYWYHTETGDIKDGLEISEDYSESDINTSPYLIVPRRNVSLLFFPPEAEWHVWSDRDVQSNSKSENKESYSDQPAQTTIINSDAREVSNARPKKTTPAATTAIDINTTEKELVTQPSQFKLVDPVNNGNQHSNTLDFSNKKITSPESILSTQAQKAGSSKNQIELKQNKPLQSSPDQTNQIAAIEENQPFQIGELVRYADGDKGQSIFQIIDIKKTEDGFSYNLLGTRDRSVSATSSNMISVELDELLELTSRSVIVQVVMVIERNDRLLMDANNQFPAFVHDSDKDVMDAIKSFITSNFKSKATSIEPLSHIAKGNTVTLAYQIKTALNSMGKYSLKPIRPLMGSPLIRPLIMQKEIVQLQKELKEIERFLPKKPPIFSSVNKDDLKHIPYQKDSIVSSGVTDNSDDSKKYILRLERIVRTNIFGDVQVVIEYDPTGPRGVQVESPRLSSELKHLLNTVLNLIDYVLRSGTSPADLSKVLEDQPKTMRLPLNDLLQIISVALQDAPENVSSIRPDVLKSFTSKPKPKQKIAPASTGKKKKVALKGS